ncbi:MAG: glycosyltransferase family 4 protein [Tannerella sp.]|jgi:glycosyltransferase involved in cell wall biosynthesis|nr:glycosyltransferase family 4 protein [Tannerella sp.]
MKILFIIPGSGDSFYCGNCFRDNLQASALRKAGHDVAIMPLYLPLRNKSFQADAPLFFPATTYYTAQKFFGKRKMPKWLERITGSDRALDIASSMSGTTSAEGMEAMTLSMITGDDPAFADHVDQLINWIKNREAFDIIHLSSTLLIGIAKVLRQHMTIPVVCSVQDEEVWIDSLNVTHAGIAWQGISENIRYIDRFITTSEFYKKIVRERIPGISNIEVIYPGVDREKYATTTLPKAPTIGFFYRMNRENGLHILAEAFVKLKKRNAIPNLRLKIGGGYTGKDKRFLRKVKKILAPYKGDIEIDDSYSLEDHVRFYHSITVITVPLTFDEGVGLYLCEAFAAGRPAVEPASGSFPEIVGEAGILYQPNNSDTLADALEKVLTSKENYNSLVEEVNKLSLTRYNQNILAEKLESIYKQL